MSGPALTKRQMAVLILLMLHPERMSLKEIAHALELETDEVRPVLDRLESAHWVERTEFVPIYWAVTPAGAEAARTEAAEWAKIIGKIHEENKATL